MNDMSEVVALRMNYKQAIQDFNMISRDNKYLLQMLWVTIGGLENLEKYPEAQKALSEMDEIWKLSGRQGKHRTKIKG